MKKLIMTIFYGESMWYDLIAAFLGVIIAPVLFLIICTTVFYMFHPN